MAKLKLITHTRGTYAFQCPACGRRHLVFTKKEGFEHAKYDWNGDIEKPTVTQPILVNGTGRNHVHYLPTCHSIIKDGMIQYISDSTHNLSGQTVELPEIK